MTAISTSPGLPSVQTLSLQDVKGALSIGVSGIKGSDTVGAARLSKVVAVNLEETIAANTIVNIRAPRGLIEGNADHISLVVAREVLANKTLHSTARDRVASDGGVSLVAEVDLVRFVGLSRDLLGFSSLASFREDVSDVEESRILRRTIEFIEVILIPLLFIISFAHELNRVSGISTIEVMDGGSLSGQSPRIASCAADLLSASVGPAREVRYGHITGERGRLASWVLVSCPSNVVTSFEIISVDFDFNGLTVMSVQSVGFLCLIIIPSSGHNLVRMILDFINTSAELSGPSGRSLGCNGASTCERKQNKRNDEFLHFLSLDDR